MGFIFHPAISSPRLSSSSWTFISSTSNAISKTYLLQTKYPLLSCGQNATYCRTVKVSLILQNFEFVCPQDLDWWKWFLLVWLLWLDFFLVPFLSRESFQPSQHVLNHSLFSLSAAGSRSSASCRVQSVGIQPTLAAGFSSELVQLGCLPKATIHSTQISLFKVLIPQWKLSLEW